MSNRHPILVIAATGKTGRRVADRLEAQGNAVRRASRSGSCPFDWNDRSTWGPALEGVVAAYVVYSPDLAVPAAPDAITAFTALAKQKGVRRLVLLSGRGEEAAQRCERIVQDSGIDCTIVRASWFAQNFDEGAFHDLVLAGEVALPAGAVLEPFIDIDDIADIVVAALTTQGHTNEVYEVTGPRLMTFADAIADIAAATGRDIRYVTIPREAFQAGLTEAGMPSEQIELLDYLFTTVLDGRNAKVTDGVQRALGRSPRDFRDYARTVAASGAWISPQQAQAPSHPQPGAATATATAKPEPNNTLPSVKLRLLLAVCGLLALGIGAMLLLAPVQFHASSGIEIPAKANLLSEIRAPGGSLLVFGSMMLIGVFAPTFTRTSTAIGAALYLAYGGARLLSIGVDGIPGPGLLAATAVELVLGALCALAVARSGGRLPIAVPSTAGGMRVA